VSIVSGNHPEASALTTFRTIMFAGHETTAKSVRTLSSAVLSLSVVLTGSPAYLWTLGVGQEPGLPGETPRGNQRDSGESQGERRCRFHGQRL